jgi:nucleotide-binding universal stress UspA family protein
MELGRGLRRPPLAPRRGRHLGSSRVVVGVSESPSSVAALRWADDLCRRRGWRLDVVTAWPDVGEIQIHEVPGHYCEPRGRAVAALERALAESGVRSDSPEVRIHVDNADPVEALATHSRGARLLVLGASGSGRSRQAGSPPVGDSCRRLARCPVVVVDRTGAEPLRTGWS